MAIGDSLQILLTTTSGDGGEMSNTAEATVGLMQVELELAGNLDTTVVTVLAEPLPRTGQYIVPIAWTGLVYLLAGAALLLLVGRRPRRDRSSS